MTALIIIGVVAVILIGGFIGIMNTINQSFVRVDQAKADVEIYMVKRYDVLTESVRIAKKFAKHEEEIFSKMVKLRKGVSIDKIAEQAAVQAQVESSLLALAEAYPDLKSQQMFSNLQHQLSDENEHYAAAKRSYNAAVSSFNQLVVTFPNSIVAGMIGKGKLRFLEDETANTKKEVRLDLD